MRCLHTYYSWQSLNQLVKCVLFSYSLHTTLLWILLLEYIWGQDTHHPLAPTSPVDTCGRVNIAVNCSTCNIRFEVGHSHYNFLPKKQKLLGLMYRRFYTTVDPIFLCRLYISLVRPILEYACQVWDPYTHKNTAKLESVQKFALKVCSHCWNIDYDMLLDIFQLPSLSAQWEYLRITTL